MPDIKHGCTADAAAADCLTQMPTGQNMQYTQRIALYSIDTTQHVSPKEDIAAIQPLPSKHAHETTLAACKPWMPCMTAADTYCDAFSSKLPLTQHVQHFDGFFNKLLHMAAKESLEGKQVTV